MSDTIQKLIEFEFEGPLGCFTAGEALVAGFVYTSGTAYTVLQCGASGTKRPIGISTGTYSAGKQVTVIDKGIVNLIADVAMSAGQPVFPAATAGRVTYKGKTLSGVTIGGEGASVFQGGFGTVVKGASASGVVQVKLQVL